MGRDRDRQTDIQRQTVRDRQTPTEKRERAVTNTWRNREKGSRRINKNNLMNVLI